MKAAVHLGPNYTEISDVNRSTNFEELKNLLDLTQRLILVHEAEIQNVSPIDWTAPSWTRSTLTHDHVIMWMQEHSDANQRWKDQLDEFRRSNSCRELFRIGGGPIEFEWYISQDLLHWRSSRKKDLQDQNIELGKYEEQIIFMSMFNGIDWTREEIQKSVFRIPNKS